MKERMRILIGYDGSECADAAIGDLRRAGLPKESVAIVFSVVENWLLWSSGFKLTEDMDEKRSMTRSSAGRCSCEARATSRSAAPARRARWGGWR